MFCNCLPQVALKGTRQGDKVKLQSFVQWASNCLCMLFLKRPFDPSPAKNWRSSGGRAEVAWKSSQAAEAKACTSCGETSPQHHFSFKRLANVEDWFGCGKSRSLCLTEETLCLWPPLSLLRGGSSMVSLWQKLG